MRRLIQIAVLLCLQNLISVSAIAAHDGLVLNGLASYAELKRPFYIAALYLETSETSAESILQSEQRMVMEMAVTAKRWSPRRFSGQWSKALIVNNELDELQRFDKQIIEFNDILKGSLGVGDRITIERTESGATLIAVNDVELMAVEKPGFFILCLRTWIGARPPSTDFKTGLLSAEIDAEVEGLFLALTPDESRRAEVAAWTGAGLVVAAAASETAAENVPEQKPKPTTKSTPKPKVVTAPVVDNIKISKPALVAASAATAAAASVKVAAAPVAAAVPKASKAKPAVAKVTSADRDKLALVEKILSLDSVESAPSASQEAEDLVLKAQEQDALMRLYKSMMIKGVLRNTVYPSYAMKKRYQGTVVLEVTVERSGNIISVSEKETSRYKLLNDSAKKAVKKVESFPPIPAALEGETISVDVPFKFILRG